MAIGFWMNNKNCYGCKTCSIACKSEKQLDNGRVAAACDGNSPGCSASLRLPLHGLQPLRRACLCGELPGRGLQQAGQTVR